MPQSRSKKSAPRPAPKRPMVDPFGTHPNRLPGGRDTQTPVPKKQKIKRA